MITIKDLSESTSRISGSLAGYKSGVQALAPPWSAQSSYNILYCTVLYYTILY